MSITVDHEPLAVEELGLETIGQVLSHVARERRLVVQVLVDGQEPQSEQLASLRHVSVGEHAVYIETADPRSLAVDVLDEMSRQLGEAEEFKSQAALLLQQNQVNKALEQLGACIRAWQDAKDAVLKTAELLRLDLTQIESATMSLADAFELFATQLRQIKAALEERDFVLLSDILLYETAETTKIWLDCITAVRGAIEAIA